MANEGLQVVLRTLRSIARASGRVSIVIMILLMLVDPKRELLIFYCVQLYRERSRNATQEIEFVLVHGDRAQSLLQHILKMVDVRLLRLDCFLMLDESFQRFDDAVLLCHSISVWVWVWVQDERTDRCGDAPRHSRKECQMLVPA